MREIQVRAHRLYTTIKSTWPLFLTDGSSDVSRSRLALSLMYIYYDEVIFFSAEKPVQFICQSVGGVKGQASLMLFYEAQQQLRNLLFIMCDQYKI